MDSFEFNKISGAVLGTVLLVLGVGVVGEEIFHSPKPEKQGFAIEVAEAAEAGGAAAPAEPEVSLGTLLASADAAKGATGAKACAACHDFAQGGPNKTGPGMYDVVGRKIASHEGFAYSDALKGLAAQDWTYENLDHWLKNPKEFAKGNKMAFAGIKSAKARADLLAYLASLSAAPKPFPAP